MRSPQTWYQIRPWHADTGEYWSGSSQNRAITLVVAAAVLGASLWLVPKIGTEFIPTTDEGQFQIVVKTPPGTDLETTAAKVRQIEAILSANPAVDSYSVTAGAGGGLDALLGGSSDAGPSKAVFTVTGKKAGEATTEEVMAAVRREAERITSPAEITCNIQSTVIQAVGGMEPGVTVTVSAPDRSTLEKIVPQVQEAVASVGGVTGVRNNLSTTRPELQVRVDRSKALRYGLTPGQVAVNAVLAVKGDCRAAGIPSRGVHGLRHTLPLCSWSKGSTPRSSPSGWGTAPSR